MSIIGGRVVCLVRLFVFINIIYRKPANEALKKGMPLQRQGKTETKIARQNQAETEKNIFFKALFEKMQFLKIFIGETNLSVL